MYPPVPPTSTEIIILLLLDVAAIGLLEFSIYTKVKKHGYRMTCRQILRLQMIALRQSIGSISPVFLLWLVMTLPLIGISVSTELSAVSVIDLILTKVRPLLGIEMAYLFLFLTVTLLLGRFLVKYGSIYKLPFMFFVRDDVRQYLEKHQYIHMALFAGSITYVVLIINLFMMIVDSPLFLSKVVVGIITAILLVEVLPNKKYENAISFSKKFTKD